MISYHCRKLDGTIGDQSDYVYGWRCVDVIERERLEKCITTYVWSPIKWKRDVRNQGNFAAAKLIGLDFDKDVSIDEIKGKVAGLWHIIGTTKNHRLEKNGLLCDRFRLILRASVEIDNLGYYRSVVDTFIDDFGADKACRDGARFFYPCTKIFSSSDGECVSVVEALKKNRPKTTRIAPKNYTPSEERTISTWIVLCLENGIPPGDRNNTVFRIVGNLLSRGFAKNEIEFMILDSAIPSFDFDKKEISAIIANAKPRSNDFTLAEK